MTLSQQVTKEYLKVFGKKLRVQDKTELTECDNCTDAPGKVYNETGWNDEGTSQEGYWSECSKCEGTGLMPIQVNVNVIRV